MDLIPKIRKPGGVPLENFKSQFKTQGIAIESGKPSLSFLKKRLVILGFVLIILSLAAWGAIKGYDSYLKKQNDEMEQQIQELGASQDLSLADKFIKLSAMIESVHKLLQNHILSSKFFTVLERLTLPQVQWTALNLDITQGLADLKGRAAGYSILARQIVSFEDEGLSVEISGVNLTKLGVEFSAKINFNPKTLMK